MNIPGKLKCEIRVTINTEGTMRTESTYSSANSEGYTLNLAPLYQITIIRRNDSESGVPPVRNMSDSISLTKYHMSIFLDNLTAVYNGLKIPSMYGYDAGNKLQLNEVEATKIIKIFKVWNTAIEMAPVVILNSDDTRMEGIKLMFSNEESMVLLTLTDIEALMFGMNNADMDAVAIGLFQASKSTDFQKTNFDKPATNTSPVGYEGVSKLTELKTAEDVMFNEATS